MPRTTYQRRSSTPRPVAEYDQQDLADQGIDPSVPGVQYDQNEFIIPVAGEDGGSMPMAFRCQPIYDRQITEMIAAKKFPYLSKGDVLRHALHRHLDYLHKLEPTLGTYIPMIEAINTSVRAQQDMIAFNNTLEAVANTVNSLIAIGMEQKAREIVASTWHQVQRFRDEAWREKFLSLIRAKFANMIPDGSGISLLGLASDGQ